jgi:hypothetical protein
MEILIAVVLELDPFKEIVVCHFLILLGHITSKKDLPILQLTPFIAWVNLHVLSQAAGL